MRRATAWSAGSATVVAFVGVGLCARDRHGPPGAPSRLEKWLHPVWYHKVGVTLTVSLVDAAVTALLSMPGRTWTLTTESREPLAAVLQRHQRPDGAAVICVANHTTFLDAAMLAPVLGRASASDDTNLTWLCDSRAWPFSVASASLLFAHPVSGTLVSMLCALPVQPRWIAPGVPQVGVA